MGEGNDLYGAAADREEKNMSDKPKILVVDDDRRMVKTICDILRVKGYETLPAYSGEEAVQMVNGEEFDCVLMDIKMPGINGVDALKMIKGVSSGTPVVMMSANASFEQAEEARLHGAASVLTKPIDFQQILSFLALLRKEESVLIVDDDPAFSRTLKDILQANGYHVKTEEDPAKVLGHLEQQYQLAVILDLKLGTADGLDVLKDVRAHYPGKPVVLVTGYRNDMSASIEQGMKVGAYSCLYKPFEIDNLIRIIEDISRRKRNALLGEPYYSGVI
ncbi:MAG: response regulator [Desulfuromonadales bacterium]|nr:response regulator [Desulfuromonadales bacterium]